MAEGHKDDAGKNNLSLIVPGWMWEVGLVLTHGANKHGAYNWQKVEPKRYQSAIVRHFLQHQSGEIHDGETGLHHMAHLACSAMFLWYFDEKRMGIPGRICWCKKCNNPVVPPGSNAVKPMGIYPWGTNPLNISQDCPAWQPK